MNIKQQTARLQKAIDAMSAKGLSNPMAQVCFRLDVDGPYFSNYIWFSINGEQTCKVVDDGNTFEQSFDNIDKHIAALKSPAEIQQEAFMASLGRLIDQGRNCDIDMVFLNPLEKAMKDLSENIVTDQR